LAIIGSWARTLLALVVAGVFANVATAAAAEPIEGQWQEQNGRVLEFFSTGSNTYSDRIVVNVSGGNPCFDKPRNTKLTGSGLKYSGSISFYRSSDCSPVGDGKMEVTIAADAQTMKIGYSQPSDQSCCSSEVDLKRVVADAEVVGALPVLVNGFLLRLQPQYKQLPFSGASRRRRTTLKAIAGIAKTGKKGVGDYNATASEKPLKTCALSALNEVAAGAAAKSKRKIQLGMSSIARCLKGYKALFPGGKPGGKPPPRNQPQRGPTADFVGVGTDPKLIPRVEFSYDLSTNAFPPPVIKVHLTLRVACLQRGVFYLELDSRDFPPLTRYTDAFGHFASFGAETFVQGLKVDFAGVVEGGGGVHGTLQAATDRNASTDTCASSKYKRWYARRAS
jgi:hypothetical protein